MFMKLLEKSLVFVGVGSLIVMVGVVANYMIYKDSIPSKYERERSYQSSTNNLNATSNSVGLVQER